MIIILHNGRDSTKVYHPALQRIKEEDLEDCLVKLKIMNGQRDEEFSKIIRILGFKRCNGSLSILLDLFNIMANVRRSLKSWYMYSHLPGDDQSLSQLQKEVMQRYNPEEEIARAKSDS